jgi:serine/threonine protein kinase
MLHHKAIVSYEDEFLHMVEGALRPSYVYVIIMEFCSSGDLTDLIRAEAPEGLSQSQVMKYFLEICEAVRYIHARDIIHRDIKSPNIFISDRDEAKLGDFGLCIQGKTIVSKVRHSSAGAIGTNCYMAPELHKGHLF